MKAKITKGDIKITVAGIEYPITQKGFKDAFKKMKLSKASFEISGKAINGKDKIKVKGEE